MCELYDIQGKKIKQHDLQDKSYWCRDGEKIEEAFIRLFGKSLNLEINPEKKDNPYVPDLINIQTGQLADLKQQATPFFQAGQLYEIDPTYAVVFNEKDKIRYQKNYPNIIIYYWVNWLAVRFKMGNDEIIAKPLKGIWTTDFPKFEKYLTNCPIHYYRQRINDTQGNARGSYVCDIRNQVFKKVKVNNHLNL